MPETRGILEQAVRRIWEYHRKWRWRRRFVSKADLARDIGVVADLGGPADAASVLACSWDAEPPIAHAAARAVAQLVKKAPPQEWVHLYDSYRYCGLEPDQVRLMASLPTALAVYPLGVASLNGSGYVREAALHALSSMLDECGVLPFVVLRLADWVEPVRKLAHDSVRRLIKQDRVFEILDYLPLMDWLERVQRVNLTAIREDFVKALRTGAARPHLIEGVASDTAAKSIFCLRALEPEIWTRSDLIDKALSNPIPVVRHWTASRLWRMDPGRRRQWAPRLLQDKSSRVRAQAIRHIDDALWQACAEMVRRSTLDDSASVRLAARFVSEQHREAGFDRRAREAVAMAVRVTPGMVGALGEAGASEDVELLAPFLEDSHSKVRVAALEALAHLKAPAIESHALNALHDSSRAVRRLAVRILARRMTPSLNERVREVFQEGSVKARLAALCLLCRRCDWQALKYILRALGDDAGRVRNNARSRLKAWLARSATLYKSPSPELLAESRRMLQSLRLGRRDLSDGERKRLDWLLRDRDP